MTTKQAIPTLLYGTAWKEDETQRLTELALAQGFRGIDTANQRKHYFEAAVGKGLQAAIGRGAVRRDDLFLQTKYTFQGGQDHRLPYDAAAPIAQQVGQSLASSLEHLGVDALDSYLLHGPNQRPGLGRNDWEAWHAMEAACDRGLTRQIGVSNVTLEQLELLCSKARIPPRFVQNRCYAIAGWDRDVRQFCQQRGIVYQGFSLLTANRQVLADPQVVRIASQHGRTPAQVVFRFALAVGMLPLTGTTDADHMRQDLSISASDFTLRGEEVALIESLAG